MISHLSQVCCHLVSNHTRIRFILVVLFVSLQFVRASAHGQEFAIQEQHEKDISVAILQMLEAKLRANYEKITTWSGTYRLKDESMRKSMPKVNAADRETAAEAGREAGNFWMERNVLVRFAIDMKNNLMFTTYDAVGPDKYTNTTTGEIREFESLFHERHILTPEHWIRSIPAPMKEDDGPVLKQGEGYPSAIRAPAEESQRFMAVSTLVSPKRLFGVGKTLVFDRLQLFAAALQKGEPCPLKIVEAPSEAGTTYTLRVEYRMGGAKSNEIPMVVEYVFDPSVGHNLSSSKTIGVTGKIEQMEEWNYDFVSGIYIPARHSFTKYKPDSDQLSIRREFISIDTKLNETIPDDVFTWNSAGLQNGDEIVDKIEGKMLRYKDGELIPELYRIKSAHQESVSAALITDSAGDRAATVHRRTELVPLEPVATTEQVPFYEEWPNP